MYYDWINFIKLYIKLFLIVNSIHYVYVCFTQWVFKIPFYWIIEIPTYTVSTREYIFEMSSLISITLFMVTIPHYLKIKP